MVPARIVGLQNPAKFSNTTGVYDFGLPTGTAPGPGVYRLCWSFSPGPPESDYNRTEKFLVEIDDGFVLSGPFQMSTTMTCTMGTQCALTYGGFGLNEHGRAVVLEAGNCGDLCFF